MTETLLSILCAKWMWDPNKWCTAKFKSDNTGELYCRVEFNLFIAHVFEWRALSDLEVKPSFPYTIDIEMTLMKRIMDIPQGRAPDWLEDAAFQPKIYRLQLDEGKFLVRGRTDYGFHPSYQYRLLWDKSPYPPFEEWKHKQAAKACKFWERNDFYRGQIDEPQS